MGKRKRPKNGQSRAVKLALKSVLRDEYRDAFVAQVEKWCHVATKISILGSLLFLFKCNKAFDDDDNLFFRGNGTNVLKECFNSILNGKHHTLPLAFRDLVQSTMPNFEWPELSALANAFNYLIQQYTTNVKNNIKVWSYSRIHTFFKLQRHQLNLLNMNITEIDVKNATKYVMFNNIDPTENVRRLLDQAVMIGIPVGQCFRDIVRTNWFQTIPIFINIQRQVFEFHQNYELLNDLWRRYYRDPANNRKPTIARPPKIRNFHVIPVHNFKMKHIRIDSHQFYQMACKLDALKAKGWFGRPKNISKAEYDRDPAQKSHYWNLIFKMDKISKVGNRKEFDFAIVTDSVAVSLCYVKPERPLIEFTNEQINDMYENNQFTFVLGMDPGVRTWNATVRKHIQSGVEVCHNLLIVFF